MQNQNNHNLTNEEIDTNSFNNRFDNNSNYQNITPDIIARIMNKIPPAEYQQIKLFVRYPSDIWKQFILDETNGHQLIALFEFVNSNEVDKTITVPHSVYGYFTGFFHKEVSTYINYNDVYSYKRDYYNNTPIMFIAAPPEQIGFVNRVTS
jgi:hypothetical protein